MKKILVLFTAFLMVLSLSGVAGAFYVGYNQSPGYKLSAGDNAPASITVSFDIQLNRLYINDVVLQDSYGDEVELYDFTNSLNYIAGGIIQQPELINFIPDGQEVVEPLEISLFCSDDFDLKTEQVTVPLTAINDREVGYVVFPWAEVTIEGINNLNVDGRIDFEITATGGDFYFESLHMKGTIEDLTVPPAVPIPTAAWLFGTGMIAIIGIRRKFV